MKAQSMSIAILPTRDQNMVDIKAVIYDGFTYWQAGFVSAPRTGSTGKIINNLKDRYDPDVLIINDPEKLDSDLKLQVIRDRQFTKQSI